MACAATCQMTLNYAKSRLLLLDNPQLLAPAWEHIGTSVSFSVVYLQQRVCCILLRDVRPALSLHIHCTVFSSISSAVWYASLSKANIHLLGEIGSMWLITDHSSDNNGLQPVAELIVVFLEWLLRQEQCLIMCGWALDWGIQRPGKK